MFARFVKRRHAFALGELSAGHAARDEGVVARNFFRELHGSVVDVFGLGAVAGAAQIFARSEKGKRLKHLGSRVEKLPVQFAQGMRVVDGDLRGKLSHSPCRCRPF